MQPTNAEPPSQVMDLANPFGYKEYIQQRIQQKREQQQATRITKTAKTLQANKLMADRIKADIAAMQAEDAAKQESMPRSRREIQADKKKAQSANMYAVAVCSWTMMHTVCDDGVVSHVAELKTS
jgi:hypothetical protein